MSEQCCALNDDGKKCRRRAVRRHRIFGSSELYSPAPWVLVPLCAEHETPVLR